jgi:hypothetical protein
MKPKGFDHLDLLILNNDVPPIIGKNGNVLDPKGITLIYLPEADDVIKGRLQGLPAEHIKAALVKAQKRREEDAKNMRSLRPSS